MDDVYKDINEYNLTRKRKILIVFDEMIADIMATRKFQIVVKEFFIRCKKSFHLYLSHRLNFFIRKDDRWNYTHYLIMNINDKKEKLQNIATNNSADTDYKEFMKIYREWLWAF